MYVSRVVSDVLTTGGRHFRLMSLHLPRKGQLGAPCAIPHDEKSNKATLSDAHSLTIVKTSVSCQRGCHKELPIFQSARDKRDRHHVVATARAASNDAHLQKQVSKRHMWRNSAPEMAVSGTCAGTFFDGAQSLASHAYATWKRSFIFEFPFSPPFSSLPPTGAKPRNSNSNSLETIANAYTEALHDSPFLLPLPNAR